MEPLPIEAAQEPDPERLAIVPLAPTVNVVPSD